MINKKKDVSEKEEKKALINWWKYIIELYLTNWRWIIMITTDLFKPRSLKGYLNWDTWQGYADDPWGVALDSLVWWVWIIY